MTTILERLSSGLEHHRRGRAAEAESLYREVLAEDAGNADALHLLGLLAAGAGRHDVASGYIVRAIRIRPDVAAFHNSLGNELLALGRPESSCLCFEQALRLQPGYAEAYANFGNALQALGRPEEAEFCYAKALELNPELAEAHNNLGNARVARGRLEQALGCFGRAIELRPDYAEARVNLAGALLRLRRPEQALAAGREAVRLQPELAEAWACLGGALLILERFEESEVCLREALRRKPSSPEILATLAVPLVERRKAGEAAGYCREALAARPDFAEAHNNLGTSLQEMGQEAEAERCYRRAIELKPDLPDAHHNLGNLHRDRLRLAEACACYDEAIRLDPGHVKARWNRSLTLLLAGDWQRGWEEFDWRWKTKWCRPRVFRQPGWDGSPLDGRAILLHPEQGLGDVIQFIRYAPMVKQLGGTVIVECPRPLADLLRGVDGIDRLIAAGEPLPDFDVHAPLLSLPRIFGTRLESIPARTPYLSVEEAYLEKWKKRLRVAEGPRVGLVWAGNPLHAGDGKRSITLDTLAPLARVDGVEFFSLQFGPRACQASAPPPGLRLHDLSGETADFRDAAAALANLDLLISVDTAMVHLAGALARTAWLLLAYVPDWRWMLVRDDTPWYPAMRLFRQEQPGDWAPVIARVAKRLQHVVGERG
jgi:tetratricopeptide (TPR) repeat protein